MNVYLVECNNAYKIGKADDVMRRITQLQVGAPSRLKLIAAFPVPEPVLQERAWHHHFASKKLYGEWFSLTTADIEEFCSHEARFPAKVPEPPQKALDEAEFPSVLDLINMEDETGMWLTVDEAAERKGLDRTTIYKAVQDGRLPSKKVFRRIVISKADVDAFQAQKGGARPGAGRKKQQAA